VSHYWKKKCDVQFFFKVVIFTIAPLQYNLWWKGLGHTQFDDVARIGKHIFIIVHFSGREEVSEHGIVVKHGTTIKK
jgi:hypothetical protein